MTTNLTQEDYQAKESLVKAIASQDEGLLTNHLDDYKGSYSTRLILELIIERVVTPNDVLDVLNKFYKFSQGETK